MSLQASLKALKSEHSYMEIYTELMVMMKQEYDELQTLFGKKGGKQSQPVETQQPEPQSEQQEPQKPDELKQIRVITKKQEQKVQPQTQPQQETSDSKQMKQWQKDQEQKKLNELTAQGIDPQTLLTIENLRKWITDEGKTFAYVAREYLGLPEGKVAEFGKKNSIQSQISRKRAVLAATQRVQQLRSQ
jgi:hypothetical protein